MQLETITPEQQPNVIHCYWVMLKECESSADDNDDRVLKVQVEGFFRLWNEMTGTTPPQQPVWVTREQKKNEQN